MRVLFAFVAAFSLAVSGSLARAQESVGPEWDSSRILELRSDSAGDAIFMEFGSTSTAETKPDIVKSGVVRLWHDFDQVSIGPETMLTDYLHCRALSWTEAERVLDNANCHAGPAFRMIELANRLAIGRILAGTDAEVAKKMGSDVPYWPEQQFATQLSPSTPLTLVETDAGLEWKLGDETVTSTSRDGLAFEARDRQRFARYLSRYLNIHPQVRAAILDRGVLPSRIEILQRAQEGTSRETITFSAAGRASLAYPLPPGMASRTVMRSQGDTYEARGLGATLGAIAGTAQYAKPGFPELMDRLTGLTKQESSLEATLVFLELTQLYGSALFAEPDKMARLRGIMPDLQLLLGRGESAELWRASDLAGKAGEDPLRESAAAYLANARAMDALDFGTFRYVTFANLVRISPDSGKWDEAIFKSMPSLPNAYWAHIAAHPWSSNAFKDLGDTYYSQYETYAAWEAWDLGRTADPDWRGESMQAVEDFEKQIRARMPDDF